jgi:hypothetical protein
LCLGRDVDHTAGGRRQQGRGQRERKTAALSWLLGREGALKSC